MAKHHAVVSREQFLALPWSAQVLAALQEALDRPTTVGALAVRQPDGRLSAIALTRVPPAAQIPDNAVALWRKSSRAAQAVALVDSGMSNAAAAATMGITRAAVGSALRTRDSAHRCPTCNQVVASGYKIRLA